VIIKPCLQPCMNVILLQSLELVFTVVQRNIKSYTWVGRVPSLARDSPSLHTLWDTYRRSTCTDTWLVQMSSAVPPLLTPSLPWYATAYLSGAILALNLITKWIFLCQRSQLYALAPRVLHLSQLCSVSCLGNLISQFVLVTSLANRMAFWLCHIKTTS